MAEKSVHVAGVAVENVFPERVVDRVSGELRSVGPDDRVAAGIDRIVIGVVIPRHTAQIPVHLVVGGSHAERQAGSRPRDALIRRPGLERRLRRTVVAGPEAFVLAQLPELHHVADGDGRTGEMPAAEERQQIAVGVLAGTHRKEIAGGLPLEHLVGLILETQLAGALGNVGEKPPAQIIGQLFEHRRANVVVGVTVHDAVVAVADRPGELLVELVHVVREIDHLTGPHAERARIVVVTDIQRGLQEFVALLPRAFHRLAETEEDIEPVGRTVGLRLQQGRVDQLLFVHERRGGLAAQEPDGITAVLLDVGRRKKRRLPGIRQLDVGIDTHGRLVGGIVAAETVIGVGDLSVVVQNAVGIGHRAHLRNAGRKDHLVGNELRPVEERH